MTDVVAEETTSAPTPVGGELLIGPTIREISRLVILGEVGRMFRCATCSSCWFT